MKEYTRELGGSKVTCRFLTSSEIKDIESLKPVTQVSGMCFNDKGKIVIVSSRPGKWGIPGGKPENGETKEETLKREVSEEACLTLGKIAPVGFLEIIFPNNPNKVEGDHFYQARFIGIIGSVNKMIKDPATGILFKRKLIKPGEFIEYVKWGDADELVKGSLKKFKEIYNEK